MPRPGSCTPNETGYFHPAPAPARRNGTAKSPFSGRFYGMDGRLLHAWDFNEDGTFYHATAVQGKGTSVRTGERGDYPGRLATAP